MASHNTTGDDSVTSNGLVAGDNPIHHALLLLILQVGIIVCFTRFLALLLRPLKQPRVVAEIMGGILLGPTALGHIPGFTNHIFPQSSMMVLETVAELGLIFFLFLVGLELNIKQIRKSGAMTLWMAAAGILLPFGLGAVVAYIINKFLLVNLGSKLEALALFLGVALSITAFPVLARILAERKLLNTEIGRMAMSAAAINDVVAWVLLALAVTLTNSGSSPLIAVWVLLLGVAFLVFMFLVVSPITHAFAHSREPTTESVIAMTLLLVLGAAFLTDLIGIHVIFGAFICGLIIPKEGPFAAVLIEKVEDYVTVLFLPLYFAVSGLKTQLSAVNNGTAVLILILVITIASVGKVLGTFVVAKIWGVESRKAIALGFLMNTKGLVELIVLNIGLSRGVLNQELFAIMVVMAIVTTFITTPVVMWLYEPARDIQPYIRRSIEYSGDDKDKLRLLLCPFGSWNVYAMMNMVVITRGEDYKSLRAYVLHLIECSERLSSIRKSTFSRQEDRDDTMHQGNMEREAAEVAFQTYAQMSRVSIKTDVAVSAFYNMHIDICNTACSNRVNFLILPFHMRGRRHGVFETKVAGLKEVNLKVLRDPPCSVGILVDNGFGGGAASPPVNCYQHIYVLFFGGPDDREALMLAHRMLQHDGVEVTVIQFVIQGLRRHCSYSIRSMSSRTLMSHLRTKSALERGRSALKRLARQVVDFFAAPWVRPKCVKPKPSSGKKKNLSSESTAERDVADGNKAGSSEEVHVSVDNIVLQTERNMDIQALARILAAATKSKKQVGNQKDKDIPPLNSNQDIHKTNSELQADIACKNLTLRVVETQNLEKSVLDAVNSAKPNGLIITGLHLHKNSPIIELGAFPSVEDHGLGPVGDFLVSNKHLHMQGSLLVVKQHSLYQSTVLKSSKTQDSLHPVAEEAELSPSVSSARSNVDASTTSV
ncbi:hypothetical protein M758_2G092000 [Ceratodon purpureus]|nr:hypothetical protein M758_2G092000 [Ceratodon purpureus]